MRRRSLDYLIFLVLAGILLTQNKTDAQNALPCDDHHQKSIQTGRASWYSETDPGINIHTANNEVFDDSRLTAAMWEVPFNQFVKVTNLNNGKSVVVRVNDRGPHKRFVKKGRIIDLTKEAFSYIASVDDGLIDIQLELL